MQLCALAEGEENVARCGAVGVSGAIGYSALQKKDNLKRVLALGRIEYRHFCKYLRSRAVPTMGKSGQPASPGVETYR